MASGGVILPTGNAATKASVAARALRAFRRHGPFGFAGLCAYNAYLLATGRFGEHAYVYDDAFDRAYGVDTLGHVAVDEIAAPAHLKRGAEDYEATSPACFRFLIDRAGIGDPSGFTFVDIGSGKGRILILAGLAGFREVVGVEFGEDLHATAVANLDRMRRRGTPLAAVSVHLDAGAYPFPPQPTICFMNNPFGGELLGRVVANIETSLAQHPRPFTLIYLHCNHADRLRRPGWTEIERGCFENRRHPYAIYRWKG